MLFTKGEKILFIGDSISDYNRAKPVGEGLFGALGTSWVADVAATLEAARPELGLRQGGETPLRGLPAFPFSCQSVLCGKLL